MQLIKLTKGQVTIIDDCDCERLAHFKWRALWGGGAFYAATSYGPRKGASLNKCIKLRHYSDELYSSILRGTSRDEYLSLRSAFLIPWLLADRSWCRVWHSPLDLSESLWLKLSSQ